MNTITPNMNPSFGMALKYNKQGKKFFQEVFADNKALGDKFIRNQAGNAVSDIILEGPNKVSVTLNNEKWKVVNSLRVFQNSYEEVMLMKPGNILSRPKIKTVICESETPFAEKYGEKGKLLAAAECIADFESSKFNNKKPGLIKKITLIIVQNIKIVNILFKIY